MQRAFATDTHHTTATRATKIAIVTVLAALMLALAPATRAQEATPPAEATPAASPVATTTDQLGDVLIQYEVDDMPNAPMTVRLLRITLQPGASSPMHTHPGHEFDFIESGALTIRSDGAAVASIDGQQAESTEPQTLTAGDWVMFPGGVGMNLANESDEPVVILSAVILAVGADTESTITYTEGQPTDADFEGVSYVVLGDGLIQQFPDAGATVIIDELTVPAGEAVPGYSGAALLSKTSGTLAFAADQGTVQVTRTATPQLRPNAIPGQEFTLADNDAAFFPAGYEAIERPNSDTALVLTRLLIMPQGEFAETPATVSVIEAESTATEEQPTGTGIGIGAIIALSDDGVRVRSEATTDSDIVESYPAGTQFEIIGGPQQGEDFTWYQVRGVGELADVEGWLTTDFMDVIEPAADGGDQTATTTEAETPEATEAPVEGEFAVGDSVVTNVENLRIREEPSTEGEAINTLPEAAALEIIGGPEAAEDYVWYQIEVVDTGATGWVAADFLEAAGGE